MTKNWVDSQITGASQATEWLSGNWLASETVNKDRISIVWTGSFTGTMVVEKHSKPDGAEEMIVPVGCFCDSEYVKEKLIEVHQGVNIRVVSATDFNGNIKVRLHAGRRTS